MNVARIISKVVKVLPQTKGASLPMSFEGQALQSLERIATENLHMPQGIMSELTKGLSQPKVDIFVRNPLKAKTDYAQAVLRISDGKRVVKQGVLSVTNPGQRDSVVKLRITDDKGQHIKGFFDSGKLIDTNNIGGSLYRKNGILTTQAEIGQAYAHDVRLYENELLDLIGKAPNGEYLINKYNQFNTDLRLGALDIANNARRVLRGEYAGPIYKFEKVAPAEFAKVVEKSELAKTPVDFEKMLKECNDFKINKKLNMDEFLAKHPEFKDIKAIKAIDWSKFKKDIV